MVLPYLGGGVVVWGERTLKVAGRPKAGWLRFDVVGALAVPVEKAEPEGLERLAQVRGHLEAGVLFEASGRAGRVHLLPDEQPSPLSPCSARRLATGQLVFEAIDFDTEREETARGSLDEGSPLSGELALPASLRLAFGWATLSRAASSLGFRPSLAEALPVLDLVASGGPPTALAIASRLKPAQASSSAMPRPRALAGRGEAELRASASLEAAGARLLRSRGLGGGLLELTFRLLDRKLTAVVEAQTLRLVDPGVCLSGAHPLLTLDCLPSVVREAAEAGRLYVTRR